MATWPCPPGVTAVLVETWGPGGGIAVGAPFVSDTSGGAGGGAYSRKAGIPTIPGNNYPVQEGVGQDTQFGSGPDVLASKGGTQTLYSISHAGGQGGQASSGIGDTKFSGGDGGITPASFPTLLPGGGGGGGAGRFGDGSPGVGQTAGAGADGGNGGNGGAPDAGSAGPPVSPGGGGGGPGNTISGTGTGSVGARGGVLIYDDTSGNGWAGVLAGTSPVVGSFGSPPPPPTPPATPRRSAFFM